MFCEKCGNKLEDDDVFCTECGHRNGDHGSDQNGQKAKKSALGLIMLILIILLLIIAVMVGVFFLYTKKTQESERESRRHRVVQEEPEKESEDILVEEASVTLQDDTEDAEQTDATALIDLEIAQKREKAREAYAQILQAWMQREFYLSDGCEAFYYMPDQYESYFALLDVNGDEVEELLLAIPDWNGNNMGVGRVFFPDDTGTQKEYEWPNTQDEFTAFDANTCSFGYAGGLDADGRTILYQYEGGGYKDYRCYYHEWPDKADWVEDYESVTFVVCDEKRNRREITEQESEAAYDEYNDLDKHGKRLLGDVVTPENVEEILKITIEE